MLSAGCNSLPAIPGTTKTFTTTPTDAAPMESAVTVSVAEKDPIFNTLDVTFAGGNGQVQVRDLDVVFTGPDRVEITQKLHPVKGEVVTFPGTNKTGKVVVYANYFSGKRYKILDQLVETRTSEPSFTIK